MGILSDILPNLDALIFVFNALAGFNAFIIVVLFVRYARNYAPATPFLMVFLLGMFFVNFMTFLIKTGYILYVPWLFRLPSPLYYAMFPAVYLYLRMTIQDQSRLRKIEWLHFLPALLHLWEYLPFYLSSNENKVQHIMDTMKNPLGTYAHDEGVLPAYIHNMLRATQGVIYGGLMLLTLWREIRSRRGRVNRFAGMRSWLLRLSLIVTLFSLSIFSTFIGGWASPDARSLHLAFWSALTLAVCSLTLFYNPFLLYGMPLLSRIMKGKQEEVLEEVVQDRQLPVFNGSLKSDVSPAVEQNVEDLKQEQEPEWLARYIALVEKYKSESKSYLHPKYCIRDMSVELGIPQHHLSYVLNKVYSVRFNDFVNHLRIDYLRHMLEEKDVLRQLTLEGLAREAGFTSRVTFIRAVQRTTGKNPSEYFRHLSEE
jgi:AraC-like DNA-binding protein